MASILKKWEYLSKKGVLFQSFINFHYPVRPFVGIIFMKIAFVVLM